MKIFQKIWKSKATNKLFRSKSSNKQLESVMKETGAVNKEIIASKWEPKFRGPFLGEETWKGTRGFEILLDAIYWVFIEKYPEWKEPPHNISSDTLIYNNSPPETIACSSPNLDQINADEQTLAPTLPSPSTELDYYYIIYSFLSTFIDIRTFLLHEHLFISNLEKCDAILKLICDLDWEFLSPESPFASTSTSTLVNYSSDSVISPGVEASNPREAPSNAYPQPNESMLIPQPATTPLETIMQITRILSRTEDCAKRIGQKQGIQKVVKVMLEYATVVKVQIEGFAILANLVTNRNNRTILLNHSCISLVLNGMKLHPKRSDVQIEIFSFLANFGFNESDKKTIVLPNDLCSFIIRIMWDHLTSWEVNVKALQAIGSLSKYDTEYFEKERFVELAVILLDMYSDNVDFMRALCTALGSLVCRGLSLGVYQDKMISAIIACCRRCPDDLLYQITAFMAIAYFTYGKALSLRTIQCYNIVDVILNSMKRFPFEESLQTTAFFALGSLVTLEEVKEEVLHKGGIPLILQALDRRYASEVPVRSSVEDHCIVRSSYSLQLSGKDGETESGSSKVLLPFSGAVALLNLMANEKCRMAIAEHGGLHIMAKLSKKFENRPDLILLLFHIFAIFSKSEQVVYARKKGIQTLQQIASVSVACSKGDVDNILPTIPIHLHRNIRQCSFCIKCQKACSTNAIYRYSMYSLREILVEYLCTPGCAEKVEGFKEREFFYVNSSVECYEN